MEENNKDFFGKLWNSMKNIGISKLLMIAVCGVALVILSVPTEEKKVKKSIQEQSMSAIRQEEIGSQNNYQQELQEQLRSLLQNVKGVGKTEVMITLENSGEEIVLYEKPYSNRSRKEEQGEEENLEEEYVYEETVVFQKDSEGNEQPYIISVRQPEIRGIAVVCQGGNQPELVVKITSLIEALFHVPAHKISVIGMK